MKIKGIIFDFNGTMFYDKDFQEKSWLVFIANKLKRTISDNEFNKYIHGRNMDVSLNYFFQKQFTPDEILALGEEKESYYRQLCLKDKEKFKLASGLEVFLDKLVESSCPINIATASGLQNINFFFEQLNLGRWFDRNKIVYFDGTFKGKPEPDIYIKAAQNINKDIKECCVFEDAISGIEAAYRAYAAKIIAIESMLDRKTLLSLNGVSETVKDYKNMDFLLNLI